MPEISLKAYFAKLNNLLSVSSADEVVQHARHILQTYPKNVAAYRYLGRGLVLSGRWDEGREALRRVLSVYPDDYIAHLGLSEANEHLGHADEAIWHLERAYEQNSNNRDVIEALRNLYRRYRGVENLKMQLTSAAVSRQYLRSKDYTQAIDTLRSARAKMNDRLDLKLLLAQVLWEQGAHEEAAENAVEVLKVLPDCLEANRIMAQLWLSMGRPSDAQRYVNHLEAVDPYLAVEVAQGYAPEDDVFRLDELDYVRTSQSELASARPDWLSEIGAAPLPMTENGDEAARDDWSSLMLGNKADAKPSPVEVGPLSRFTEFTPPPTPQTGGLTDLFGEANAAPADELRSLFERSTSNLDEDTPGESNLLRRATTRFEPEPENTDNLTDLFGDATASHTTDLDSLFSKATGSFGDEDSGSDDRMAWLRDAGVEMVDDTAAPSFNAPSNDDRMAWMRDSGIEMRDEDDMLPSFDSLMAEEDDELPEFDSNPMAWLEDHSPDMILESNSFQTSNSTGEDELLSWMQQEDDFAAATEQDDFSLEATAEANGALDWLQSDPLLDDATSAKVPFSNEFETSPGEDFAAFSATGTDWQNDMLDQAQATTPDSNEFAASAAGAPSSLRGLTAILQDSNFDWVNQEKPQDAGADADMDDWLNQFAPAEPQRAVTDSPDWLTDISYAESGGNSSGENDEWFEEEEPDRLSPAALANAAQFAMMSTDDEDEEGDWLSALPPEEEAEAGAESDESADEKFEWSGDAPTAETNADTGALPDWLNDYVPAEAGTPAAAVAAIDWGSGSSATADDDEESALTDWLSELEPDDEEGTGETAEPAGAVSWTDEAGLEADAAEETDWLAELAPASSGESADAGDASWLAELGTGADEAQAEPATGDDMGWLSEFEPEAESTTESEPVAEAEAVTSDDMSWLNELGVGAETLVGDLPAETAATADDDESWLAELGETSATMEDDALEPAVAAGDDMSWLSELGETSTTTEDDALEPAAAVGDESWLAELGETSATTEDDALEPAAAAGDDMSWLNELEPDAPAEVDAVTSEANAVNLEDFPWMNEDDADAVAETPAETYAEVSAVSDDNWLNEFEPDAEQAPPVTLTPADPADLEWLSELDEAASQPVVNAEDFPWMAEAEAEADAEPVVEPVAAEEADWVTALQPEADTTMSELPVTADADEDMSWLSELEPTSDAQKDEAQELAAVVAGEADDWLSELDSADDQEEAEVVVETPASEIPDWLSELEPDAEPDTEPEPAAESVSDNDWLESEEADEAEAEPEAAAAEMPSWLADLEPIPEAEADAVEEVAAAALNSDDWLESDEADDDAFVVEEEVLEPTPAINAPDWLNAMVPGLDVDYEASDQDSDFSDDDDTYEVDEREYAWVEDIVEEEMAAVESTGSFTFTRPPAWFASFGSADEGSRTEDDFPDWISDDSDLPDYLR